VKIPPLAEDVAITPLYTQPYVISFTVPASVIPPVYQTQQTFANPPKLLKETVLVYLFPVSPSDIDHTETVLSESLGLSNARVKQLIKNAPVALAGFSERIDALVAISEFAAHGIPVSLVPGSSPGMDQAPGGSLFGWLNGNERTS